MSEALKTLTLTVDERGQGGFELEPVVGKALTYRNASSHGLNTDAVLPGETRAFLSLARGVFDDLQPVGTLETQLTARICTLMWRLQRLGRYEGAQVQQSVSRGTANLLDRLQDLNESISASLEVMRLPEMGAAQMRAEKEHVEQLRTERDSLMKQIEALESLHLLPDSVVDKLPRYEGTLSRALSNTLRDFRQLKQDRRQ